MIVVIGALTARAVDGAVVAAGLAAAIARSAARAGASVEVIARIGDDPDGDGLLLDLARAGAGHVAILRDPSRPTVATTADADDDAAPEAEDSTRDDAAGAPGGSPAPVPTLESADVALAMRYITDFGVVALVHPTDVAVVSTVAEAVGWASAHLVVIVDPAAASPTVDDLPAEAVVVAAGADAEGPGLIIGRYLAAVDGGTPPGEAVGLLRDVEGAG